MKKMRLFKSDSILYLFYLLAFTLNIFGCGADETQHLENNTNNTGTYQPTLIFPADIPREESIANALTGIDCEAAQISTIEFTFIVDDSPYGPFKFACQDHQASIKGISAGTDIRVDVYAYDEDHTAVLYGYEMTNIVAGQVTQGGEIEMKSVDVQPPGTNVDSITINDLNMEFVRIPAGEFIMGSPVEELGREDDENRHRVRITQDFFLQATEVTQKQWRTVVLTTDNATLNPDPSYFTACGDKCPVERVSWDNVQLFIDYLNIRYEGTYEFYLPTEAQWEYAARAGSDTAFADGDITITGCGLDPVLDPIGWYCFNSRITTQPVGEKSPSAFGLFDIHGNVWEWCQDYYEEVYSYTTEPVIDPQGPAVGTYRVLRGGGRYSNAEDCRSAKRWRDTPNNNGESLYGFRLVCSPISN